MPSLLPTTLAGASAGCELVTRDDRALTLVAATLHGEAQGGLARLVLEQRFENPYAETLQVMYRMPLPADGAISGYAFVIGDRVVTGTVDKKRRARERFETAIASGQTAALLEQERADIFTQEVGNIPPRTAVIARITIDQRLVWLPEGEWELRFPTVIGARYIGTADSADDVRATHIKVSDQPLPVAIKISIAVRDAITAGAKPSSPSHLLEYRDGQVELASAARLDRDIVLRWPVATPLAGVSLGTARPASGADAYALLTIVPPTPKAQVVVPRDLLVLLDTSGSMGGFPLDKAKQVVCMMIDSLDEHDRLELIEFSGNPRRYLDEPVLATAAAKQAAIKWVRSRVADGGTEMRAAVIEALTSLRVGAQRQVVVVTDGYVGGEQQILEALNRRLPKSCRLHVLGVGSAVNRSLATALARAGRGVEAIVGVEEDAERSAKRLLDRTRAPVVTNLEISGSAVLRQAPAQLPDCFAGAPLVAALTIKPDGGEILVRGQLGPERWEQRIEVAPLEAGQGNQAIVALYGRERVADVEANAIFGSVDGEIEELGLTFQIATRTTSWVAIDEVRREVGPSREELVPQEIPYGTTAAAFGLRGSRLNLPLMAMAAPASYFSDAFGEEEGAAPRHRGVMPPPSGGFGAGGPHVPPSAPLRAKLLRSVQPEPTDAGDFEGDETTPVRSASVPDEAVDDDVLVAGSPGPAASYASAPEPRRRATTQSGIGSAAPQAPKEIELAKAAPKQNALAKRTPAPTAKPSRKRWLVLALLAVIALLTWWLSR